VDDLNKKIPVLLHIHDFDIKSDIAQENPLDYLIKIIKNTYSDIEPIKFSDLLRSRFNEGSVLLLLDGLDELQPKR